MAVSPFLRPVTAWKRAVPSCGWRVTRWHLSFCNPAVVLRTSEVLDKFKIFIDGRMIYSGRAVVGGLIDAGARIICEVKLDDMGAETDFFLQPFGADLDGELAYSRFFPAVAEALLDFTGIQSAGDGHPGFFWWPRGSGWSRSSSTWV